MKHALFFSIPTPNLIPKVSHLTALGRENLGTRLPTPCPIKPSILRLGPGLSQFYPHIQQSNKNTRKQSAVNTPAKTSLQNQSNLFFSCPWLIECYWFHIITVTTSHQFSTCKVSISWGENTRQTEKQRTVCWIRNEFLMQVEQGCKLSGNDQEAIFSNLQKQLEIFRN